MTDQATGSGAAALAGNPAGATTTAAAAQATTATTQVTPPAVTAGAPAAGAAATTTVPATGAAGVLGTAPPADTAPVPEWFGKLPEATRKVAEAKGWKADDPGEAFAKATESYTNLEKLLGGSERIVLPTDPKDQAGWDKVWNRLGRPDKPEGYGLDKVEGADPTFAKSMSEAFHKAGVPASMAKALTETYQGFGKAQGEAARATMEAKAEADLNALKSEKGAAYDEYIEAASRVVARDGLKQEDLAALESVWGTRKLIDYFGSRAAEVMEDKAPKGALQPSFSMTPDAAQAEITTKMADKEFLARYTNENPKIRAVAILEMERLHKLKTGVKP